MMTGCGEGDFIPDVETEDRSECLDAAEFGLREAIDSL